MKWISFILFALFLLNDITYSTSPSNYQRDIIQQADSLYSNKLYKQALQKYLYISQSDDFIFNDPAFDFKLAHCYFKNGQYLHAKNVFKYSELLKDFLPEYTDFIKFKTILFYNHDELSIEQNALEYIKKYNHHFFVDSVNALLADYMHENRKYQKAIKYYSGLMKRSSRYKRSSFIKKQIAIAEFETGKTEIALNKMRQFLKIYPGKKDALEIVEYIQERRLDDEDLFFPILDVYLSHGKVKYLNNKIEAFIASTEDKQLKDKAKFYLYRVHFLKRKYQTALQGFLSLFNNVSDDKLNPKILVYIARSYLRLNDKEKSAETYISYSKKYPRRRLAAECAWKAAWINEELNYLQRALDQYRAVQKHWPRSEFRYEAAFREALTLYRLGNYTDAIFVFDSIINSRWNSVHKNRAKYWLALTYKKLDRSPEATKIFVDLGKDVFVDFYTTKAYLNEKAKLDSILFLDRDFSIINNPLQEIVLSINYALPKFRRLFLINELMGKEYAILEMARKEYRANNLTSWVTRAEVFKKLGDFDDAFKIYDMIDYTFYPELDILDKPFILKEKYPFYFDTRIHDISSQRNLEKYFILAIIRAESGFDKYAHSWANAYGLMQIIPRTAKELAGELNLAFDNPTDLFEEELNLKLGIYYVSKLANQYNNQKEYILAAYNAGPHRVSRWKKFDNNETMDFLAENIEFSQTRNYIKKVMKNYWIYSILKEKY